mmetsp:Transcript_576/g.1559  ORF Transcript_576/g.1559 Transcript_576/m.1559 type:complete len:259 (+) Transcript_576:549-1325(+)
MCFWEAVTFVTRLTWRTSWKNEAAAAGVPSPSAPVAAAPESVSLIWPWREVRATPGARASKVGMNCGGARLATASAVASTNAAFAPGPRSMGPGGPSGCSSSERCNSAARRACTAAGVWPDLAANAGSPPAPWLAAARTAAAAGSSPKRRSAAATLSTTGLPASSPPPGKLPDSPEPSPPSQREPSPAPAAAAACTACAAAASARRRARRGSCSKSSYSPRSDSSSETTGRLRLRAITRATRALASEPGSWTSTSSGP